MSQDTLYVSQFGSNIQMGLQQEDSRLGDAVTVGNYVGKKAHVVDFVDPLEMQEMTGRGEPIVISEAGLDRRWVSPKDYDLAQLIHEADKIRQLGDPTSAYTQTALAAARRKKDRLIIAGFFADAKTGEEGTGTTSFDSNMQVAVNFGASGSVGMTIAKIRKGKLLLLNNEVDEEKEEFFLGLTPTQRDNLYAEYQVISGDFKAGLAPMFDAKGKLSGILGITFKVSTLFQVNGSSHRRNPLWVKSGMHWGNWKDIVTDLAPRKDLKGHPQQAYVQLTGGATRTQEEKVAEILCAE